MLIKLQGLYALRKAPNNPRKRVLITDHDPECKDSCFRGLYVGTQIYDRWFSDGSYRGPGIEVPKDLMEVGQ